MAKLLLNRRFIKNILYSLMVFTLAYLYGMVIGIELNILAQLVLVSAISTLVSLFILNPLLIYILLIIAFVAIIILGRFFPSYMVAFIERAFHLFNNIFYHIRDIEIVAVENRLPFWGILIVLLSTYSGMIIFKNRRITSLLPIYMGWFLYYWYLYYDQAYWMMALFLFLFLILLGLDRYFREEDRIKFKDNLDLRKFYTLCSKSTFNYGIIIILLALILPKNSYSIHWPWLEERVEGLFPSINDLRPANTTGKKYLQAALFDFSSTGFQKEASRLGDPVVLDDTLVMTVYAEDPIYLRGSIKHRYTGYSWERIEALKENFKLGEDFSKIPPATKIKYFNTASIELVHESFASQTLFSPYKAYIVNFEDNSYDIEVNYDGEIFFPQGVYPGESYTVEFLIPFNYEDLIQLEINERKDSLPHLSHYLQIPQDKITKETINLVKEIVKDKKTDLEKALALEEYLRNNYSYNLEVEEVPANQEFIHHFLFESKEGYCTYFATALAIMLRIEEIPTRYIEGYLAHEKSHEGVYQVKNSHAHAWVEAFIEPIGWMTLDATPAYAPIVRADNAPSTEEEEVERLPEDLDVRDSSLWLDFQIPQDDMEGYLENNEGEYIAYQDSWTKYIKNLPAIIIGLILLSITMRFLINYLRVKAKNKRIRKLPNRERVIYLYDEIVKLAGLIGGNQKKGETHYEYAHRIDYNYKLFTAEKDIKGITEIFVRNKYGNSPTPDQDVEELESYKSLIASRIRKHLGYRDYYYKIYFKGD